MKSSISFVIYLFLRFEYFSLSNEIIFFQDEEFLNGIIPKKNNQVKSLSYFDNLHFFILSISCLIAFFGSL